MAMEAEAELRAAEVEADGSACICCGDPVFLTGWKFTIWVAGRKIGRIKGLLCQSCGEEVAAQR